MFALPATITKTADCTSPRSANSCVQQVGTPSVHWRRHWQSFGKWVMGDGLGSSENGFNSIDPSLLLL
jgi:hypothetical protein